MNVFLVLILTFYIGVYFLHLLSELLNLRYISCKIPEEFIGYYNEDKYIKSLQYLKVNTKLTLIKDTLFTFLSVIFILAGGFNYIDIVARSFGFNYIGSGIIFVGILLIIAQIMSLPFEVFSIFVIEKKYGFNKTTISTFILDRIKLLILSGIIGSLLLAGVLWFFTVLGNIAWLITWLFIVFIQLFLYIVAPIWIMPLFNKFIRIEEGELRDKIQNYVYSLNYKLEGVYQMDGSKRSTKTNAFFTGFGRFRRIVLFDTLIEKHTVKELVAVIAHEMGHYKMKHIYKLMFLSLLATGIMLFIFSWFINNPYLFAAFKMEHYSIYASLIFFGFLFTPIELVLGVFSKALSRRYEYEADEFAAKTTKDAESMIEALKKLSVENLSNLKPHPLKVVLEYSHPPVLERIGTLRNEAKNK